jgi:hypothetical protein
VKKIDVFCTEKNGNTWRKMALFRAVTLALNVGSWAMQGWMAVKGSWANIQRWKNGATLLSAEKNGDTLRKLAPFSATAVARTFFH